MSKPSELKLTLNDQTLLNVDLFSLSLSFPCGEKKATSLVSNDLGEKSW